MPDLVLQTVNDIEAETVQSITQEESMRANGLKPEDLKHAPKIFKADMEINWNKSAKEVYHQIKGLSPYPTAFTKLNGLVLKVYDAEITEPINQEIGTYTSDKKTFLKFQTTDQSISIKELQLEGKKRMKVEDFLRGYYSWE
jgi:methionyl-tRNA formyltransferase